MGMINLGKIVSTVTNAAKTVGNIAHKVADFGGKAVNILKNPEKAIGDFVHKAAGNLLDKLPFGLGKIAKPFADKLIDHGLSFLDKGVLGSVMSFAKKIAPNVGELANFAEQVGKTADKVGAFKLPSGLENIQNLFARAHADGMSERYLA